MEEQCEHARQMFKRQLQEQQVGQQKTRRMHPRERGSPEQLQDLARSCHLEQINIVMQAFENEPEYL